MRITLILVIILSFLSSTAFAGKSLPALTAKPIDPAELEEYEGLLEGGCSLGCAIGWEFATTSSLKSQAGNSYGAKNLGDYTLATAWVEGVKGHGVGEKITIIMKVNPGQKDVSFRGMDIVNGYAKNKKSWSANSRVKTLRLYHNKKPKFLIQLKDTKIPQYVSFSEILINAGDIVVLEIVDIYPGAKYQDTAISEINLYGAH